MTLIRNTRGGAYEAAELSRRAKTTCDGEVAVADEMSSYLLSGEPRRGAKWIVCLEINKAICTARYTRVGGTLDFRPLITHMNSSSPTNAACEPWVTSTPFPYHLLVSTLWFSIQSHPKSLS